MFTILTPSSIHKSRPLHRHECPSSQSSSLIANVSTLLSWFWCGGSDNYQCLIGISVHNSTTLKSQLRALRDGHCDQGIRKCVHEIKKQYCSMICKQGLAAMRYNKKLFAYTVRKERSHVSWKDLVLFDPLSLLDRTIGTLLIQTWYSIGIGRGGHSVRAFRWGF